jgi:predicted ATP-grasp superfamily ATP-dependent carboligase
MVKMGTKVIYVTRDIERALGLMPNSNYWIVSNKTPYAEKILSNQTENILLIESKIPLDTAELLEQSEVKNHINKNSSTILVFKNTSRIENICKENGWNLLNPSAALSEKYENKITQIEWLGELAKYLPSHSISLAKDLKWLGKPLIIQWAHGHTGDGTILVKSKEELSTIQEKFPERMMRATAFIEGPSFTVNVVVAPNTILVGSESYQITGLKPFTDNPFSTVGNDWGLTRTLLNKSEINQIEKIAKEIGERMRKDGWKGLFGIDIIRENESNKIYLIEINARQPASTTFESSLSTGLTLIEAHLLALQSKSINQELAKIDDGAQIIQRITKEIKNITIETIQSLESAGYSAIPYVNTEINSDLLRIQSKEGIIGADGKLNNKGKKILELISTKNQ